MQIIVIKPRYTNTGAGVNAGDTVFQDHSDGTYASEVNVSGLTPATDGVETSFTATLFRCRANTIKLLANGVEVAADDGAGNMVGLGITGSVDYDTGVITAVYAAAPAGTVVLTVSYFANSEVDAESIRELEINLDIIPVTAKAHPLRVSWSTQAAILASASINLDVEDTMTLIAGQYLRIERDRQLVKRIEALAGAVHADLTFDASHNGSSDQLSRKQLFSDMDITIAIAENLIFEAAGRGGVNWVIAGTKSSIVFQSMDNFVAATGVTPIGAHVIGTVGDKTIIKDPGLTPNDFLVGYNGIMPGDAGVIIADFIPLYFSPNAQQADLRSAKALLSMYDIVSNVSDYYRRGTVTGL